MTPAEHAARFTKRGKAPAEFEVAVSVGDIFTHHGATFRVVYVRGPRVTLEPVPGNVRTHPGAPACVVQL